MYPGKPGLVINVGVTGHRNINDVEKASLTMICRGILIEIYKNIEEIHKEAHDLYSKEPYKLQLISSIAEGFDRIAAAVSLEFGYELQCPLPFSRDEYLQDFETDESVMEFKSLLSRANSVYEINLGRDSLEKTYLNAGSVMLEHTDILLTFWDGKPSKGPGGTGDIVELAREKGIPVIQIDRSMQVECEGASLWEEKVKEVMMEILYPFNDVSKYNFLPTIYFNEDVSKAGHAGLYNYVLNLLTPPKVEHELISLKKYKADDYEIDDGIKGYYSHFLYEADELAKYYSNYYRSAGIFKAVIPMLANIGLAIGFYWRWGENTNLVNVFGFLSQAFFLYWLVRSLGDKNEKKRWHQKFIDYRILAECLRYQAYLAPFGLTLGGIEIPAYNKNDTVSWINWYLRGITRGISLPNMKIDNNVLNGAKELFKREVLTEQFIYHNEKSQILNFAGRKLKKLGIIMFATGAIITLVRVLVHFICQIDPNLIWFPDSKHKIIKIPTFFNMLSLLLPAFGSTIQAIGTQAGFEKLSSQFGFMSEQLKRIYNEDDTQKKWTFLRMRKWISSVVGLMINEVTDWRVFVKGKVIQRQ